MQDLEAGEETLSSSRTIKGCSKAGSLHLTHSGGAVGQLSGPTPDLSQYLGKKIHLFKPSPTTS